MKTAAHHTPHLLFGPTMAGGSANPLCGWGNVAIGTKLKTGLHYWIYHPWQPETSCAAAYFFCILFICFWHCSDDLQLNCNKDRQVLCVLMHHFQYKMLSESDANLTRLSFVLTFLVPHAIHSNQTGRSDENVSLVLCCYTAFPVCHSTHVSACPFGHGGALVHRRLLHGQRRPPTYAFLPIL